MTLAAYHGHEPLTFPDYLDLDTGKTLHADPRPEPYDIAPASGRLVPDVPEAWFTPVMMPRVGTWIGVSRELTSEDTPAEKDGASESREEEPGGEPDSETE